MQLVNFGTKFPFKLGMMWRPGKIHSHPDLAHYRVRSIYQISGRNFFQVGDDVTNQYFKVLSNTLLVFTTVFYNSLHCIGCAFVICLFCHYVVL
ncbi:hypothetical protein HanIR_Chr17g0887741 [Helianthus annuus]|nr:hypothetical protein HanIR_Chr17g0887741 [Helianthus annuus]